MTKTYKLGVSESAPQLENIPWWGKNILREVNERLGGKQTKCNKINNNSENFRGARLLPGEAFASSPLNCGPVLNLKPPTVNSEILHSNSENGSNKLYFINGYWYGVKDYPNEIIDYFWHVIAIGRVVDNFWEGLKKIEETSSLLLTRLKKVKSLKFL